MQKGITYMVRPFMQPLKRPFSLAFISTGSAQWLVGPASSSFSLQMNVRSSTRATSEGGTGEEAPGALLGVQFDKGALFYHHVAKLVIFFLRAVAPVDGVGLAKLGDFFDPLLSCFVSGTHGEDSVCTEIAVGKPPVRLFMGRFCFSGHGNRMRGKALP